MQVDASLLEQFERGLDPQHIEQSQIPATLLGYGEISAIFKINGHDQYAFKRMPLFSDQQSAQNYIQLYQEYCQRLTAAGLNLPASDTVVVAIRNRPVVVYIAQEHLPSEFFGHNLIQSPDIEKCLSVIEMVAMEISKVWRFNVSHRPGLELAIDGQISNWVHMGGENDGSMVYIDTSTPLMKKEGVEQMDPEPLLKSTPGFLRWIIRWLFLDDVMNRYYDSRQIYIDIAANLHKEQRPDLIPAAIDVLNQYLTDKSKPLTVQEIEKYYREDKLLWTLFLAFRKVDRWLATKLLRRRYEFILPGKIKR
jgi:hypothetical protein